MIKYTFTCKKNTIELSLTSDFLLVHIDGASHLEVDVAEDELIGQAGSDITALTVQPRSITIEGMIRRDIAANRRKLLSTFLPRHQCRLTYDDGERQLYLDCVVETTPEIDNTLDVQRFTTGLYCAYPYWRSTKTRRTVFAEVSPAFTFPFTVGVPFQFGVIDYNIIKAIVNSGDIATGFTATFYSRSDDVVAPRITHLSTYRAIAARPAFVLKAGEKLTVSTIPGARTVTHLTADGIETNGFKYLDPSSDMNMTIDPGDNLIKYEAESGGESLMVYISSPEAVIPGV